MREDSRAVLLVEDNPDDEELTVRGLKRANLHRPIDLARDGQEALDYLCGTNEQPPRRVPAGVANRASATPARFEVRRHRTCRPRRSLRGCSWETLMSVAFTSAGLALSASAASATPRHKVPRGRVLSPLLGTVDRASGRCGLFAIGVPPEVVMGV
jgi:CheY-like chemotaxis protein